MSSFASLAVAKQTDFTHNSSKTRFAPLTARPMPAGQGSNRKSTMASQNNDEPQGQGEA